MYYSLNCAEEYCIIKWVDMNENCGISPFLKIKYLTKMAVLILLFLEAAEIFPLDRDPSK